MIRRNKNLMQKVFLNITSQARLRVAKADEGGNQEPTSTNTSGQATDPTPAPTSSPAPVQQVTPSPTINYEQLIANARKEEKAKLYPQIEKLKAEKDALVNKQNNLLLQIGEKDSTITELNKQLESAQKGTVDPKEVKELKEKVASLEAENTQLKAEKEQAKLEEFKKAEIAKVNGQVIPELITGSNEEEIKKSIELSNKRFLEVIASAGASTAPNQAPTSPAPSTFSAGAQVESGLNLGAVTPEMIANMSTEEYANYRKQLGLL